MTNFVNLGKRYINVDTITYMDLDKLAGYAIIHFTGSSGLEIMISPEETEILMKAINGTTKP